MAPKQIFPLSKLTAAIENVINTHCSKIVWVKAEIVRLNHYKHTGHCFPELVEKKNGKVIAEIRGNIWKTQFEMINKKFKNVLNEDLSDDMTVVLQATVTYHPVYGISLNIFDIDPEYTLGELARQKSEAILRLKKENIYTANKDRPLPRLPKTIAIISVSTSKGYLDFLNVIENNPWNYKFHFLLYPAVLQGEKAVSTIVRQLENIKKDFKYFDAVAILRGGGGEIGLSCYDSYDLASAIAKFPIPVLSGIGHSTNQTVSELVSWQSFITPTKLAEFLLQEFHNFAFPLEEHINKLTTHSQWLLERKKSQLKETTIALTNTAGARIDKEHQYLDHQQRRLEHTTSSLIKNDKHILGLLENKIHFLSPATILKRGFTITRSNGSIIKHPHQVKKGDVLITETAGGKLISTIN